MKDPLELWIYSICDQADRKGIDSLTGNQRSVVMAWAAKGIIDNGGFDYYYQHDWRIFELAAAFRGFGLEAVAKACEESALCFPGGIPPEETERRSEIRRQLGPDPFDQQNDVVFALKWDTLRDALVRFMADRPGEFARFRPKGVNLPLP